MIKPSHAFWLLCFTTVLSFAFFNVYATPDSTFSSWYYTPSGVFGRKLLTKTTHRSYFKITRLADQPVSVFEYNAANILVNTIRVSFLKGSISLVTQTNQWGEIIDSTWFKPDGPGEFIVTERLRGLNPFLPGIAMRYVYKNGLLQESICLADSTKPGYNQEGISHYKYERYNDPQRYGLIKRESYFGEIDNPVVSRKTGNHSVVNEYNDNGKLVSKSLYGLHDEPVTDALGNFRVKMLYDNNDEELEIDYFDVKGNPGNDLLNYSRLVREYKKGFLKSETCYNNEFVIVKPSKTADFISVTKHQYDDNGNELERTFYDQNDLPIKDARGIHQIVYVHNLSGMLTDVSYFDDHKKPVSDIVGICHYHYGRMVNGKFASKSGFNKLDMPAKDFEEGAFETKYGYDNWGRTNTISYWINDSLKMRNRSDYHQISLVFDQNGLATQYNYTDEGGKPVTGRYSYSRQTMQYNEHALIEKRAYFDGEKPVMQTDSNNATSNYHSIDYQYDFNNRVRTLLFSDASGKPVDALLKLDGPAIKCQKVELNYIGQRVASETFFDAAGSQPKTIDCESNNCLSSTGTTVVFKKLNRMLTFPARHKNARLAAAPDTTLYAGQLAFLTRDSIFIFLDGYTARLSEQKCASFYRIAPMNKYYQMDGNVVDYYVYNDSVAARLSYANGSLSGPCSYYYSSGKIKERGEYKENARTGEWVYYYESGLESKKINFTGGGPFLIECYDESGKQLAKDGNGSFKGAVLAGNINYPLTYIVEGTVKNGLMDGEWKMYSNLLNAVSNIEKFSSGQFENGKLFSLSKPTAYRDHYVSRFESLHPGERMDYYGPSYECTLTGANLMSKMTAGIEVLNDKDLFGEINSGMKTIFSSNKYREYSGWVFLDLAFDENGVLTKESVKLFQENQDFRQEIALVLGQISRLSTISRTKKIMPFEKFYIVLVEANQMVIPEEALKNARRNVRQ